MDVEDELLEELGNLERKAEDAIKEKEEAQKRENTERKQKEEERRQKEEERRQKEEAQTALKRMVKKMHARGFSLAEIAEDLGKSEVEILKMLEG